MSKKPKLNWIGKFYVAIRGIYFGVVGHSSFVVHFLAVPVVIALGLFLGISIIEWALLVLCIGLVLTTELINSAVETLFRGLSQEIQDVNWPALDIAAGAVLVSSFFAVITGGLIFIPRLLLLYG